MNAPVSPELMVVMPVFNERASIRKVVLEWFQEIENWTEAFELVAIDDGSSDGSSEILKRLEVQLGARFKLITRENHGHGQTCLQGYKWALDRGIPWVLQVDSDGQCDPQYFFRFWRLREKADVILGIRVRRDDGWRRTAASLVLKVTLLVCGRVYCEDANVPYRLMKTAVIGRSVAAIPPSFVLSNVALSVLLKRQKSVIHAFVPIRFRERYGGEPSVPLRKFGGRAIELIRQLRVLRM